jgi:hypothetical protein
VDGTGKEEDHGGKFLASAALKAARVSSVLQHHIAGTP